MSLIGAAAITAGAGLTNSIMGNTSAKKAAKQQYKYQLKLQQQNQAWQEEMSNTAHQREVADLKAAGLNPVLAVNNGASTGSGGAGSASMAQTQTPDFNEAINTAIQMKTAKAQIKNINQATDTNKAQEKLLEAQKNLTNTENKNQSTVTTEMQNDENFAKTWWGRNISPALKSIFGGGGVAGGAVAGAAVSQAATSAKKARTPKRNKIGF